MNEVFIIGKVKSEINFKFIVNSKNVAIAVFSIELLNKSKIIIKAYNEMADFCYRNIKRNGKVFINGRIISNMELEIKKINILKDI